MQTVEVIRSIGIVLLYICTILLVELQRRRAHLLNKTWKIVYKSFILPRTHTK